MKKLWTLLVALSMVLALAACGGGETPTTVPATVPTTVHTHTPGGWAADLANHSRVCADCGETMEEDAHTLEEDVCSICGAEITDWGDCFSLARYDNRGNCILQEEYDPEGNLMTSYVWSYTYDEDGNVVTEQAYENGVLTAEYEYAPGEEGNRYTSKSTSYFEDGSRSYTEFDSFGNTIKEEFWEADGTLSFNAEYEYILDENDDVLVVQQYEDGVLKTETEYGTYEEEDWTIRYAARVTTHLEDGSKQVVEYDSDFNVLSEVLYDGQGQLVDHSVKFDESLCAPFFGTWEGHGELDISELLGAEGLIVATDLSLTFGEDGRLHYISALDLDGYRESLTNALYSVYQAEGASREDANAACLEEMGMTISEYVDEVLSAAAEEGTDEDRELIYFVEDGVLYIGTGWHSTLRPVLYRFDGDSLTMTEGEFIEDGFPVTFTRTAG